MISLLCKGEKYWESFFAKRYSKLLPPVLISIFVFQTMLALIGHSEFYDLLDYAKQGNIGKLLPNSWYVWVLLVLYVVFFVAFYHARSGLISNFIVFTFVSIYSFWTIKLGWTSQWYVSTYAFIAGLTFAKFEKRIQEIFTNHPLILIWSSMFVVYILNYVKHYFPYCSAPDILISQITHALFPLLIVFIIYSLGGWNNKIFNFLGKYSYELYVTHGAFIMILNKYIGSYSLALGVISLTIIFSYLLHTLCNNIFTAKK